MPTRYPSRRDRIHYRRKQNHTHPTASQALALGEAAKPYRTSIKSAGERRARELVPNWIICTRLSFHISDALRSPKVACTVL